MDLNSRTDQLVALARLRRGGSRPMGPIILTEARDIADWASLAPNGLFAIVRQPSFPLGENASALSGIDVLIITYWPFQDWQDIAAEIVTAGARLLHLIDRSGNRRTHIVIDPWVGKEAA